MKRADVEAIVRNTFRPLFAKVSPEIIDYGIICCVDEIMALVEAKGELAKPVGYVEDKNGNRNYGMSGPDGMSRFKAKDEPSGGLKRKYGEGFALYCNGCLGTREEEIKVFIASEIEAARREEREKILRMVDDMIVPVDSIEDVGSEARYGQLSHNSALSDLKQKLETARHLPASPQGESN